MITLILHSAQLSVFPFLQVFPLHLACYYGCVCAALRLHLNHC